MRDWAGLDWTELGGTDGAGLDGTGLDGIGHDWTGSNRKGASAITLHVPAEAKLLRGVFRELRCCLRVSIYPEGSTCFKNSAAGSRITPP